MNSIYKSETQNYADPNMMWTSFWRFVGKSFIKGMETIDACKYLFDLTKLMCKLPFSVLDAAIT